MYTHHEFRFNSLCQQGPLLLCGNIGNSLCKQPFQFCTLLQRYGTCKAVFLCNIMRPGNPSQSCASVKRKAGSLRQYKTGERLSFIQTIGKGAVCLRAKKRKWIGISLERSVLYCLTFELIILSCCKSLFYVSLLGLMKHMITQSFMAF